MKIMHKLYTAVISVIKISLIKLRYFSKVKINLYCSLRGKISIDIRGKGKIFIGKKIIETGPLYLKTVENGRIEIGKNVFFNHNCSITSMESVKIGDDCFFGNNVVIVDHDHLIEKGSVAPDKLISSKVNIGKKCWIGANSVITRGVTIGDNVVIAAGAVVTKDVPNNEVWGGVPAKKIKDMI